MTRIEQQQRDAEIRRVLLFVRAANRLREITTTNPLKVKLEWQPALVQPADPRHMVMSSVEVVEAPDRLVIDNLATRLRPFLMPKEGCYFLDIVGTLPKHIKVEGGPLTFAELESQWEAVLSDTTAPLPTGSTFGNAVATREGRLKVECEHVLLTGREALELLIYGELVHIDRQKEKKLLRIRESEIEPGYKVAVVSIIASLAYLIDVLRRYAEGFVNQLPAEEIERIESTA